MYNVNPIKNTSHSHRCGCLYCKETSPSKRSRDFKQILEKSNEPLEQLLHHITQCQNITYARERNPNLPSRENVLNSIKKAIKFNTKKIQELRKQGWIRD